MGGWEQRKGRGEHCHCDFIILGYYNLRNKIKNKKFKKHHYKFALGLVSGSFPLR